MQFVSSVFAFMGELMESNGKLISIREASQLTGKSEGLIYRYIRQGKITVQTCSVRCSGKFRQVKKLKEAEVLRSFGLNFEPESEQGRTQLNNSLNKAEPLTVEMMKGVISEYFQDRETQLMKPLEELATYRVGKLEAEKQFLTDKVDTLLQELERYKALPLPVEEMTAKLELVEAEKVDLISQMKKADQEMQDLHTRIAEEEKKKQELQEAKDRELSELRERLEAEEKEKLELVETWKKALEEEQKRPWWRKIF